MVIALLDERELVGKLLGRLTAACATRPSWSWEVVLVVEGTDGTREIAEAWAGADPRFRVVYRERPTGLGDAFRLGFAATRQEADWVVTLDGDLNHQPEQIPVLIERALEDDLEVVVGSRRVRGASVVGIPLWKRVLSGTFNRAIGPAMGFSVLDATSGFRAYRRAVLARLKSSSPGFAFLPELLLDAERQGSRIGEVPIEFVYRKAGTSKMRITAAAASYLGLVWKGWLRALEPTAVRWALLVLALGAALRVALALPVYRYPAEADALLGAMTAQDVLAGQWPAFMTPTRLGAVGGYVLSLLFLVLGDGRWVVHLAPALVSIVAMVLWGATCTELLGREVGRRALPLVAAGTPALLFWTSMGNAYPEVIALCALVLWAGARIATRGWSHGRALAFGLAAGLGLWQSLQTLTCSGPALVWALWSARATVRRGRLLIMAAGFAVGVLPLAPLWLGWIPQPANYSLAPVTSPAAAVDNGVRVLVTQLPAALTAIDSAGLSPAPRWLRGLQVMVLWAVGAGVVVAGWVALRDPKARRPVVLGVLIVAAVVGVNTVSAAGSMRGMTVRYVLPAILALPFLLGPALATRNGRWLGIGLGAGLLALGLGTLELPGTPRRAQWAADLVVEDDLAATVDGRAAVVLGDYWTVYPLNWLLGGRVTALPWSAQDDARRLESRLPDDERLSVLVVGSTEAAAAWRVSRAGFEVPMDAGEDGVVGPVVTDLPTHEVIRRLRDPQAAGLWEPLFADGFESGSHAAWSPQVPDRERGGDGAFADPNADPESRIPDVGPAAP